MGIFIKLYIYFHLKFVKKPIRNYQKYYYYHSNKNKYYQIIDENHFWYIT
jgi:hypothetical protein